MNKYMYMYIKQIQIQHKSSPVVDGHAYVFLSRLQLPVQVKIPNYFFVKKIYEFVCLFTYVTCNLFAHSSFIFSNMITVLTV